MMIDEAIQQARYVADEHSDCWRNCENIEKCCKECEYEHKQIAKWLEDYKRIKMLIPIEQALKNEYNKAIDDLLGGMNQITYNCQDADELFEKICDLAEQLKAGGENE